MWRAFFMAMGISLCILGGECLLVEKAVLSLPRKGPKPTSYLPSTVQLPRSPYLLLPTTEANKREIKFPDWAPWTLLAAGVVVVLYSATVKKE